MAIALLGKCVALLALIVLLYATCYGFRIRDIVPQTQHPTVCVSTHGRICPTERTVTTGGPISTRKWHEGTVPRTIAGDRKPPAELTSDIGTGRIRMEKITEHPRDRGATRLPRSSRIESDEIDDDEEEEEVVVEVESVEEDEESVGDSERDQADEKTDDEEKEASEAELSDQDAKDKEKKVKKKFPTDDDDDKSEDNDDEDENDEDEEDEEDDENEEDDDEDEDEDKNDYKKSFKKDSKKQMKEIKTTKIVKPIKYAKSKADDDDDKEEEDDKEEKKAARADQRKVIESLKKKFSAPHKKEDEDEDEDKEPDVKETTPGPRKLEKVRLADKDKIKTTILQSKRDMEKPKQDDKKPVDVAKSAMKAESVKKTTESTRKIESVESTKESTDSTKKSVESAKKLTEGTKKVESVKAIPKPKAEVPETATKVDEKSKTRVKPETSTPAPKIKEQAKQPEKADVKKVTAKPTSKPSKEVSQAEKQETKPKTKEHTDASITLSEVNDAILRVPTFVPNFTNVENSECQQHGKIFLRQLRGYKLWALQMLDSSAKIPSGLLRGNVNQLGDYDQCLGVLAHVKVDEKTIRIQGKYCLATVDLHATHSDMRLPVHLMQARAFIRGNMHDPGHFVPKFTSFNWALCLPAACSAKDAEYALESTLKDYNGTVGIKFTVNVDPNMCYVKQKSQTYSKETIGVLYFYAMIICLVIIATVRDYFVETRGKGNYSERIIMSFSLRRTIKALLKEATDAADITCIYGIRTLAMIILYVGHQLMTIPRIPFSNRISFTEIANSPVSSILRVALVYTDTFLLLSGVLTAYNMAKELKTRGEIRWFCRFVARFIRLSPALLAVVFWYAFVMEHIGSGPQWNSVIMANAELCKYNAWTTLLYVQNFFPFEEMCASHTHQLALDMQLSLLAPILVFFLQYKLIIGMLLMAFLILLSATLRYIATINNYLSIVIYHGISLKRLYKTANLTYVLPLHRTTPYVFGVGLGVLLHYTGKNVRIHRVLVILGWLIAITLGSWSLFSPWRQAKRDYVYDAEEATHYAVIGPVLWAAALCWSIFACFTGHGGSVNRFLSSYWFMIFSRISYAVYLTQFAVFFYNVGTTRFSTEFQLYRAIDPLEVAIVIVASVVLTLLFDLPMQEVKSVIMESTDVALEVSEEKKTLVSEDKKAETAIEQANVFENDEVVSTGWDRQKDIAHGATTLEAHDTEEKIDVPTLTKMNGKRLSFIDRDSEEISNKDRVKQAAKKPLRETESYTDRKIGMNRQRYATDDSEEETIEFLRNQRQHDEAIAQRNRRSLSRTKENKRLSSRESESSTVREQHESKPPLVRSTRRRFSSESEEEPPALEKTKPVRVSSSETKTSDEEEWEHELRIRKKQFMEKLATQQRESLVEESEISAEPLQRRSSAEGRIALLRDDISGEDNMDSWTGSKRESLQDLSQLSQEDLASAGWNVVKKEGDLSVKPTGLFKRESIVKSQASEEDPEYLLPERPKLVQQEREHPFKKAWQMQKSRSEEEGSSAYTIKDSKEQLSETKAKEPSIKRELSGAQSEDSESFADDESVEATVMLRGRSTDTEDARTNSTRSGTDETDSVSTECSRAMRERDHRQSSKSETDEDSAKFNWPGEEEEESPESEIYRTGHRGKSEEVDWDWEREET
ncbi:Nose resistant to fluoxetine protein 6 [Trachymyrmex cornetzi]|uniref:Nose resistant to fluoxetine protein 6 n=1 Tax=Trachymyrmex cornetzi TaxID=471704 RepID=A0A195ECF1_9HYME|nr:Nose resistant to fluoxetine protein 6 [Trachymyrmex cornetzi]